MANGTLSMRARVWASRVLPQPVGPSSKMFDFDSSTPSSVAGPAWTACMVVDRDREDLLRVLLADHVVVQELEDLTRLGKVSKLSSVVSVSSSAMMSLHRSMHSSQMYTPGPAINSSPASATFRRSCTSLGRRPHRTSPRLLPSPVRCSVRSWSLVCPLSAGSGDAHLPRGRRYCPGR